jgi:sulfate transporter 3
MQEGIAVGRSFAMAKNYHVDGNKEMIAFGLMNIIGSCTSCYLTAGPFSRSAVNVNAGCKTAMSNAVMAVAVAVTLLFLTPLFHYTPLVVLSAIIVTAITTGKLNVAVGQITAVCLDHGKQSLYRVSKG